MDMKGQHTIIDAYECNEDILNNAEQLKELLTNAIDQLHYHETLFYPVIEVAASNKRVLILRWWGRSWIT
jgi:hypothetical protein